MPGEAHVQSSQALTNISRHTAPGGSIVCIWMSLEASSLVSSRFRILYFSFPYLPFCIDSDSTVPWDVV